MQNSYVYPIISAHEAAAWIRDGDTIGFSGFTAAGTPRTIAAAIGERAASEHAAGRKFRIRTMGVGTGASLDGVLSDAIVRRTPYQSDPKLRERINTGECQFFDMHISQLTQALRYGFLGPMEWAIVEAADLTPNGGILLTSAVGGSPTFCLRAERILVELNHSHPPALFGIHDIVEIADPPYRREIPIYKASDRIGEPLVYVDPDKIEGIVESHMPDEGAVFHESNGAAGLIGSNIAEFLAREVAGGRLPRTFLPVQSGVGGVANAVLGALGSNPKIPAFEMYTEVLQDSVIRLMDAGRVRFASCCSLTLSPETLRRVYADLDHYRPMIVLRPQEITNHPEVVRRLGLISINTAMEVDIFGNVNSTHAFGTRMMNGIGGSGDFTRNAYLSIFTCPATAKSGAVSSIVPMVTHVDHTEHSVHVIATEWGVADLRGRTPRERALAIIDNCAHPDFRAELRHYLELARHGHTPHYLRAAFDLYKRYDHTGDMRQKPATQALAAGAV
jgi:succinate CoA transferase